MDIKILDALLATTPYSFIAGLLSSTCVFLRYDPDAEVARTLFTHGLPVAAGACGIHVVAALILFIFFAPSSKGNKGTVDAS